MFLKLFRLEQARLLSGVVPERSLSEVEVLVDGSKYALASPLPKMKPSIDAHTPPSLRVTHY